MDQTNFFEVREKRSSWMIEEKTPPEHSYYLDLVNSIVNRDFERVIIIIKF